MVLPFSPVQEFHSCARKTFVPGEVHITRISPQSVLILMLEGVLRFREDGILYELHPGEYYIQREGLLQEGVPLDDPPVYDYVHFNSTYREEDGLPLRGTFSPESVLPLTERLRGQPSGDADPFRVNSDLYRLFSVLLAGNASGGAHRTAEQLYRYLETEYPDPLPMPELARKFGYTEDYLIRLFRARYGTTPHQALLKIRMEQARWLLESTSVPAEKVAFSVGYGDFSAFYRAFRKRYGIAPGEIRKSAETPSAGK